jgi:hypothetical protein
VCCDLEALFLSYTLQPFHDPQISGFPAKKWIFFEGPETPALPGKTRDMFGYE